VTSQNVDPDKRALVDDDLRISIRPMSYVFLDIAIGREPSNRLIVELFEKDAPQACLYFRALVNHPQGYKRSHFHRVIEEFMIQGGDVDLEALAPSIDGAPETLENKNHPVDKAGLVGLARTSLAENNPQFFITLVPAEHLNGVHTIFGRIVKGMEMVEKISHVEVDNADKPTKENEVVIVGCGELQRRPARGRSASPASKRPRKTTGRSRERSMSPRRDGERRKQSSESPDSRQKRRKSHDHDDRNDEQRHPRHHHHRDDRRYRHGPTREGEGEKDPVDANNHTSRSPGRHESRKDSPPEDRMVDSIPTGPRSYRPRQRYRPNDDHGRLGYVDEDEDYRDDEERLQEAEHLRDAERGYREPEVRYKGRGAMKYRERHY
jgi:peptidyl-prolyl isomerase G (cyclophilin G)